MAEKRPTRGMRRRRKKDPSEDVGDTRKSAALIRCGFSGEDQERFPSVGNEIVDLGYPSVQKVLYHLCRAVAQADPNVFGRITVQKAPLPEVRILRDNHEIVAHRVEPNICV